MNIRGKLDKVYGHPIALGQKKEHFCPGCSHGIIAKIIAEVISDMGIEERVVGVYGAGCSVLMYEYIEVKGVAAPPGSACAVATGIKNTDPDRIVFVYQGDGDIVYDLTALTGAAMRGERITVICEDNLNMGISGGAMSASTPLGMTTTTSPGGRCSGVHGFPVKIVETLLPMQGVSYLARGSTHSPGAVKRLKNMVQRSFVTQIHGQGMGFVEILGMCPTNMNVPAIEAAKKVQEIAAELSTGEFRRL